MKKKKERTTVIRWKL